MGECGDSGGVWGNVLSGVYQFSLTIQFYDVPNAIYSPQLSFPSSYFSFLL